MLRSGWSRRQFLKRGLGAAIAARLLGGCGGVPPSQQLFIYGWETYVNTPEIFERFLDETGIEVRGDSYDSLEVMEARLKATGNQLGYSIIYPSDISVERMRLRGDLERLDKTLLTDFANLDPKYLDPPYDPGSQYSIPLAPGTTGIAYNAKLVRELTGSEPTDWDFLWQHRDKLKITLLNDMREVLGMGLKSLGLNYNSADPTEIRRSYEHLQELQPAIVKYETYAWTELLAAGDIALSMAYSLDGIAVTQQDPNLRFVLAESGPTLWIDTIAMPKGAPNPEAAYAWMAYSLRPEVAAAYVNATNAGTTNRLALDLVEPGIRNTPAWTVDETALRKGHWTALLPDAVLQVYNEYWTRLSSA